MLVLLLLTLPVLPNGVLEDIQRAIRQLKQAYILRTNIARHNPNSSRLNVQQLVINILDIQKSVTPS